MSVCGTNGFERKARATSSSAGVRDCGGTCAPSRPRAPASPCPPESRGQPLSLMVSIVVGSASGLAHNYKRRRRDCGVKMRRRPSLTVGLPPRTVAAGGSDLFRRGASAPRSAGLRRASASRGRARAEAAAARRAGAAAGRAVRGGGGGSGGARAGGRVGRERRRFGLCRVGGLRRRKLGRLAGLRLVCVRVAAHRRIHLSL